MPTFGEACQNLVKRKRKKLSNFFLNLTLFQIWILTEKMQSKTNKTFNPEFSIKNENKANFHNTIIIYWKFMKFFWLWVTMYTNNILDIVLISVFI